MDVRVMYFEINPETDVQGERKSSRVFEECACWGD